MVLNVITINKLIINIITHSFKKNKKIVLQIYQKKVLKVSNLAKLFIFELL